MNTDLTSLISTRELLTFYYKNRWRLRLAFFLPLFLAIAVSFVPTPRYKASSVLTVRMGSEYVYQPEIGSSENTQQATIPFEQDQIFKSEVAILNSDDLHKEVIKQIGIGALYPRLLDDSDPVGDFIRETGIGTVFPGLFARDDTNGQSRDAVLLEKAVTQFDKRFDVELEKESSVITATFEHPNADLAVKALDTLLKLYMEKRKQLYLEPRVALAKTHEQEARQHLMAAENALETFKHMHNILSFEAERESLIQQRSDVQRQAAGVSSPGLNERLAYFENKINALNKDQAQFDALTHDVTVATDEYGVFAHRLNEATAYEDVEHERAGSVRVIQPPSVPAEPKKLQIIIIAMGFVLSLLSVLVTALAIDFLSSGFSTPESLAKAVGLPVLVALPRRRKPR
jgi:uncharacterized protein involved in exopolysaccharide biosynthesis